MSEISIEELATGEHGRENPLCLTELEDIVWKRRSIFLKVFFLIQRSYLEMAEVRNHSQTITFSTKTEALSQCSRISVSQSCNFLILKLADTHCMFGFVNKEPLNVENHPNQVHLSIL